MQDLSSQCERFEPKQELVAPDVMSLTRDMLEIWPEKELPQLIDVVTRDELMEEVLEVYVYPAFFNATTQELIFLGLLTGQPTTCSAISSCYGEWEQITGDFGLI